MDTPCMIYRRIYNRGISYGTCLLAHKHDSWVMLTQDVQTQRRSLSRGGVGCIQENPIYAIWVCLRIVRIPVEWQFDLGKSWKIMILQTKPRAPVSAVSAVARFLELLGHTNRLCEHWFHPISFRFSANWSNEKVVKWKLLELGGPKISKNIQKPW